MKTSVKNLVLILTTSIFFVACGSSLTNSPVNESLNTQTYIVTLNSDGNKILGSDIDSKIKSLLSKHNINFENVQY